MGDSPTASGNLGDTNAIEVTGKAIMMTVICVVFVVISVFCAHLYANWVWRRRRRQQNTTTATGRRHQVLRRGLDPKVLETIPVVIYDPKAKEFKLEGLECAVCLSEVSVGEKTRLLPKCNHGFHMDCIDMWFQSHSTCPLCRDPISDQNESSSDPQETTVIHEEERSGQPPNLPTNVLFWGDETQVSTFGPCLESEDSSHRRQATATASASASSTSNSNTAEGMLVIDIPRQFDQEEDQKSPVSSSSRMRSLKRLLSGNLRFNPWSPRTRNVDMEQGSTSQS